MVMFMKKAITINQQAKPMNVKRRNQSATLLFSKVAFFFAPSIPSCHKIPHALEDAIVILLPNKTNGRPMQLRIVTTRY